MIIVNENKLYGCELEGSISKVVFLAVLYIIYSATESVSALVSLLGSIKTISHWAFWLVS